jgi:hypothetical protein
VTYLTYTAGFAYEERINLLTQCREFARLIVGAVETALALLQTQRTPLFTWRAEPNPRALRRATSA